MNSKALWLVGAASSVLPLAAFSQTPSAADAGTLAEIIVTA
jgi:hypothetical protein